MRIFLTFVLPTIAFAAGAVAARRWSHSSTSLAHPLEGLVLAVGLIVISRFRPGTGLPAYGVACLLSMFVVAAITASATAAGRVSLAGTREFETDKTVERRTSWSNRYLEFTRAMGDYEFRLLLTATYLLIAPFALLARRPIRKEMSTNTNWLRRVSDEPAETIE